MAIKTIKEYIENNSINTTLNGRNYNFNEFYHFYLSFKNLGKELCKEYNLKQITITKDNEIISFPWPLLSISKINTHIFFLPNEIDNYFSQLEKEISSNEICSLSILISEISRKLKLYEYHGSDYIDPIQSKIFSLVESINKKNPVVFEYNNINSYPKLFKQLEVINPKINLMKEDLCSNDKNTVINYNYINIVSLIMHFIKIEIMYYTSIVNIAYLPKKCNDCQKLFVGKSELCETCAKARATARRKINKKCNTLRIKIENYLSIYRESLPTEIILKSERMLEEKHRFTQFKELDRLCKKIEIIINKKS